MRPRLGEIIGGDAADDRAEACGGIGRRISLLVEQAQHAEEFDRLVGLVQPGQLLDRLGSLGGRRGLAIQSQEKDRLGARRTGELAVGHVLQHVRLHVWIAWQGTIGGQALKLPESLLERVVDVIVGGLPDHVAGNRHRLLRIGAVKEACGSDGLQPHARARVLSLHAQQRQRPGDAIAPVAEDAGGGGAGAGLGRSEHAIEQPFVHHVVPLVDPQRFRQLVRIICVALVEGGGPRLGRGDNLCAVVFAKLNFRPRPHVVFRLLQEVEEDRDRLPVNPRPA